MSGSRILAAATAGCLVLGAARADNLTGAFLGFPLSPVQIGMGDVSAGAGDCFAAWANPAAVTLLPSALTLQGGGGMAFGTLIPTGSLGAAWRFPTWAVAAQLMSMSLSYPETDVLGDENGKTIGHSGRAIDITSAWRWSGFGVGVSVKSVSEAIRDQTASLAAADAGMVLAARGFVLAGALLNVADTRLASPEWRAGLRYRHAGLRAAAGIEYSMRWGTGVIGLGAEWWPVEPLGVRLGVGGLGEAARPAFGLSVRWKSLALDWGATVHALGMVNQATLGFSWGKRPGAP